MLDELKQALEESIVLDGGRNTVMMPPEIFLT
jgi:hypothetical protein